MKKFIEMAQLYAANHNKKLTFYTHLVGIPLIIFSSMVFLGFIHVMIPRILDITAASIVTLFILIYYFFLNWRLALAAMPLFIILLGLAKLISSTGPTRMSVWIFVISFILGWASQIAGHLYEGNKPAFLTHFWQAIIIAPLFLIAQLFFKKGYMLPLKNQIYSTPDLPVKNPI